MTNAEKTARYLATMGPFYVLTCDGDQPKGRAFSWFDFIDNRIWFGTGTFKNVYKQLQANPKVEILAVKGLNFVRYDGVARFIHKGEEPFDLLNAHVRRDSRMPEVYDANGWESVFFTIEGGHVEVRHSLELVEEYDV